ncbi:PKD domain-containing protein [Croceimicrobium sp.]|uniref:PKD domain-containing protein n=1 Tax=Croceimicrobium sp. TaxID=2828340 RepID=UPI003BA9385E
MRLRLILLSFLCNVSLFAQNHLQVTIQHNGQVVPDCLVFYGRSWGGSSSTSTLSTLSWVYSDTAGIAHIPLSSFNGSDTVAYAAFQCQGQMAFAETYLSGTAANYWDTLALSCLVDTCASIEFVESNPWNQTLSYQALRLRGNVNHFNANAMWVFQNDTLSGSQGSYFYGASTFNQYCVKASQFCPFKCENLSLNSAGPARGIVQARIYIYHNSNALADQNVFFTKRNPSLLFGPGGLGEKPQYTEFSDATGLVNFGNQSTQPGDSVFISTFNAAGQLELIGTAINSGFQQWQDTLYLSSVPSTCQALSFHAFDPWAAELELSMVPFRKKSNSSSVYPLWTLNSQSASGATVRLPWNGATVANYCLSADLSCASICDTTSPRNTNGTPGQGSIRIYLSHQGQLLKGASVFLYKGSGANSGSFRGDWPGNYNAHGYTNAQGFVDFTLSGLSAGDSVVWRSEDCNGIIVGSLELAFGANQNLSLTDSLQFSCLADDCTAYPKVDAKGPYLVCESVLYWNPAVHPGPGTLVHQWSISNQNLSGPKDSVLLSVFNGNLPNQFVYRAYDSCGTKAGLVNYVNNNQRPVICNAAFYVDTALALQGGNTLFVYNNSSYSSNGSNPQYFWDFGDGASSTAAFPSHSYGGNGPYQLCLRIKVQDSLGIDSCESQVCRMIALDSAGNFVFKRASQGFTLNILDPKVGLPNFKEERQTFSLYPNPVEGSDLRLYWDAEAELSLTFFELSGAKVMEYRNLESGERLAELKPGLYLMQVKMGEINHYQRIQVR